MRKPSGAQCADPRKSAVLALFLYSRHHNITHWTLGTQTQTPIGSIPAMVLHLTVQSPTMDFTVTGSYDKDLEKAASGASSICGHFVQNPANLRTFGVKNPLLLTEDGGRRVNDG